MKKYKDDLFALVGGGALLYFGTLDKELAWLWKGAGILLIAWGIITLCLNLKAGKEP